MRERGRDAGKERTGRREKGIRRVRRRRRERERRKRRGIKGGNGKVGVI